MGVEPIENLVKEDYAPVIDDIAKMLINDYTPKQQKEILIGIKSVITQHHENERLSLVKQAEEAQKRCEIFNF